MVFGPEKVELDLKFVKHKINQDDFVLVTTEEGGGGRRTEPPQIQVVVPLSPPRAGSVRPRRPVQRARR